jgi:hypothetical protein
MLYSLRRRRKGATMADKDYESRMEETPVEIEFGGVFAGLGIGRRLITLIDQGYSRHTIARTLRLEFKADVSSNAVAGARRRLQMHRARMEGQPEKVEVKRALPFDWGQPLRNQDCMASERLRELVARPESYSAKQIALFLRTAGCAGLTEQEVMRQVTRTGLRLKGRGKHQDSKPRAVAPALPAETKPAPAKAEPHSEDVMAKEGEKSCQWPIGDPADKDFHSCPYKAKPGKPYCEKHCRKAYEPQPRQRRQHQQLRSARIH